MVLNELVTRGGCGPISLIFIHQHLMIVTWKKAPSAEYILCIGHFVTDGYRIVSEGAAAYTAQVHHETITHPLNHDN